jgi:tRNA/tmRNA/rRNA uracil-C5-methylase (TrmA/RlmC/RlmD family)
VEQCLDWLQAHTRTRVVVDPFCGRGTALAAANLRGLDAIGVELSAKRAERARRLRLEPFVRGGSARVEREPSDPA